VIGDEGRIKRTVRRGQASEPLSLRERLAGGATHGAMSVTAAILAYLPTKPLGLQEGFWGSITAIAVVQSELGATKSSARDQFTGAAIGGAISAVIVAVAGEHLATYALAVLLSVLACWLFKVASAARLAGSTATIILLVPHAGSAGSMVLSRVAEVGWGVTVGLGVVWIVNKAEKVIGAQRETP
jgi:uncharacterized membrane protein YgaE (UPF0421/DUF939 family)